MLMHAIDAHLFFRFLLIGLGATIAILCRHVLMIVCEERRLISHCRAKAAPLPGRELRDKPVRPWGPTG